jgi:tRNA A-37 threonylcarbamoyl transferase component Bud32
LPSDTLARLTAALADRYKIEREIGAGGMATVYLAEDVRHRRKVAVKVLRPELAATLGSDRFFREIEVAAQLQHPHILPLLDSGQTEGFYYYVMPFIAGESLRERLAKVGELPIHDAVKVLVEVVDALSAAHAMGVVHRDIKPDNVMLSGRHALVTDFGVAKAVSEATGRNKLTTVGVALGTPAYMAPEQASADPHLDHRVDIYAVGAMAYELLTGQPPFTGGTANEILAAHVTRLPETVTARRPAVPAQLGMVIMKCLEKRPADRWQSAEDLLAQLEPLATPSGGMTPTQTRPVEVAKTEAKKPVNRLAMVGALVAVLGGMAMVFLNRGGAREAATLRDRVQLTTTGQVSYPAISPDGKQLAYGVSHCDTTCSYAIDLKDVGGAGARRLLDGATAVYGLAWSPDRRNLLLTGSIAGRYGVYLISTLGAPPRRVTPGTAVFAYGGDSLILAPVAKPDSGFWIGIAGLDGVSRDSIPVRESAQGVFVMGWPAKSPWIVVAIWRPPVADLVSIDRQGRIGSRLSLQNPGSIPKVVSDAVWAQQVPPGVNTRPSIVRIPYSPETGRFSERWDTLYTGPVTNFDVTEDGSRLVLDEGSSEYTGWALDLKDALRGAFTNDKRLMQSTAPIALTLSPNGNRVVIRRSGSGASGEDQLAVFPYAGGPETPLPFSGTFLGWSWRDSVTLVIVEKTAAAVHFTPVDVRNGSRGTPFTSPDSALRSHAPLPDGGWAWIPIDGQSIKVQRPGDSAPKVFPVPSWYLQAFALSSSPSGNDLAFIGWNSTTFDSVGLSVLSLSDGKITPWMVRFGEGAYFKWLADGSIYFVNFETQEASTAFRALGPGRVERLGSFPRWIVNGTVSSDLRRLAVVVRENHGDVWMSTVVRP